MSFEEGLTKEQVHVQIIRAARLRIGVLFERDKRCIPSLDPLYARKNGGAMG